MSRGPAQEIRADNDYARPLAPTTLSTDRGPEDLGINLGVAAVKDVPRWEFRIAWKHQPRAKHHRVVNNPLSGIHGASFPVSAIASSYRGRRQGTWRRHRSAGDVISEYGWQTRKRSIARLMFSSNRIYSSSSSNF